MLEYGKVSKVDCNKNNISGCCVPGMVSPKNANFKLVFSIKHNSKNVMNKSCNTNMVYTVTVINHSTH